jgi:hypothetical protein
MPAIPVVGHSFPAVRLSERARLDEPRGILGFLLLLFLLCCTFDPADKVLNLKVYIFALCWVVTLAFCLASRVPIKVPRGLLIYTLLFILVPLYSIVWYWLVNGDDRFEGFSMLKGYVLITLAPMLVLSRTDLLPRLCAVLTLLALAVIGVFIALQLIPELFPVLYVFGVQTDMVSVAVRDYGSDVRLLQVYFVTSPMLAISIAYYFDRAQAAGRAGEAARSWALVAINVLGMLLAGTRNNILVSLLLPALLVLYYARNKAVGLLVSLVAVGGLVAVFARELDAFFDPSEASNRTKLAMLDDYLRIFSDPINLIFGQGLGAYEYWEGRGDKFVTELTYLDMVRNFGLLGAAVMLGLLLFPVWHAFATNQSRTNKAIAIGFTAYLGMCASNPNLFSSMGILILSVMLSAVFLPAETRS